MNKPFELHCRLSEAEKIQLDTVVAHKRMTITEWVQMHLRKDWWEWVDDDVQRVHSVVERHAVA